MPLPKEIEAEILEQQALAIDARNYEEILDKNGDPILDRQGNPKHRRKPNAWHIPDILQPIQIAHILSKQYHIVRIRSNIANANPDLDLLALYAENGENKGTYVTYDSDIRILARQYNNQLTDRDFREIRQALLDIVPVCKETLDPDLIAVNNGIFNYKTKILNEFDPNIVFLSKSKTNYFDNPKKPIITMPDGELWDVDTWLNSLSDDPQIVHVLWQLIGAIIRPHVGWYKSAWFYSEKGNNGKGTLCELMRNLCGPGSYISLPLDKFNSDAMLEPLLSATAIITDENNVGTFIDEAAVMKAVITQDVISINRKYKTAITFRFKGMMIQCINGYPRIRDNSGSMHRRLLIIPFLKSFEGIERPYIKTDYLNRPEVLEYVLHKVLNTNYYKLDIPDVSEQILKDYKEYNDPIRQYWDDIKDSLCWDLVPFQYLYDLYLAWRLKNIPEGRPISRHNFIDSIVDLVSMDSDWYCEDKNKKIRTANRMQGPQPLTIEYNLKDWLNETCKSTNLDKKSEMDPRKIKINYRGIQRRSVTP